MLKDVRIPDISENVTSGKIVGVAVQVGDTVDVDDVLVEIETDKAVVEIPSPLKGRIAEVLARQGEEMQIGDVIVRIEAGDEEAQQAPEEPRGVREVQSREAPREEEKAERQREEKPQRKTEEAAGKPSGEREISKDQDRPRPEPARRDAQAAPAREPAPAAPSVRRFARRLGVDIHEVAGSGPGGRITQEDVSAYVHKRLGAQTGPAGAVAAVPREPALPDFARWGSIREEELETVRRLTAENTWLSWRTMPHVTQFDRADITDLLPFMRKHAAAAERKGGKLTITAVLMKICALALRKFPAFNASIDLSNRRMIYKDYVHIGVAVDTPRGLLVPVVRDADRKSLVQLAADIVDIAERARNKKIKPEEFEGGTFTISNQGGIGGVGFTPVVVWPQAAILGVSRAARELVDIDGEFQPRTLMPLGLSYDHRIVDGADAARFLRWICESLAQPMTIFLD